MARDQTVGRRSFDAGIPGGHHGLQQRKRHDRDTDPENRQYAAQFVAQDVTQEEACNSSIRIVKFERFKSSSVDSGHFAFVNLELRLNR